jgi:hypothetical protein
MGLPPAACLVIDDFLEAGPFGEIIAVAAQMRGIVGLVTSGSVRDRGATTAKGLPVFAKGLCVKGTDKLVPAKLGAQSSSTVSSSTPETASWAMPTVSSSSLQVPLRR